MLRWLYTLVVLTLCAFAQNNDALPKFHGTYEELLPQQKKLIDEWYAEYNAMTGDHASPTEYSDFSLSTKTTFQAVTHALMTTGLTDKAGKSMGNALTLVQSIEAINGKVPRARGDMQFRLYVLLKPEAMDKLKASGEFFRDRDNTVYHRGYPLNYRQGGGVPSIQISMAKDGRHADIDVDYRSSGIPAALFNGHLSAANSDVRAGKNTQIHLNRWQGLTDWWASLFGTPEVEDDPEKQAAAGEIPTLPRYNGDKVDEAVNDFLSSWLVEQKPELAAAYLSSESFSCLEEYGPQAGREINAGVAPYLAVRDFGAASRVLGKPARLQDAIKPSPLDDHNLKAMKQPYDSAFTLYQVPELAAANLQCNPEQAFQQYDKARVSGAKSKFGKYYVAAFRLNSPQARGDVITLLWMKDGKRWRVASWDLEPEDSKPAKMPDTRLQPVDPKNAEPRLTAAPELLRASDHFLRSWLVADNFDAAAAYFSPLSYECVGDYLAPEDTKPSTPAESAAYIRKELAAVGKELGAVRHLRDAIEPVQPTHEDLRMVGHPSGDAYTLIAVPDSLAGSFLCRETSPQHPYQATGDPNSKQYGTYYASLFALRTPGDHPAALSLLWGKEQGQWKIIAYELTAP